MTPAERRKLVTEIAAEVVRLLRQEEDVFLGVREVAAMTGWSRSYIYKNKDRLGGFNTPECRSLRFSRLRIKELIRGTA